ncbi:MAG: 4Fe-4S binding protein [Candidatus Thermoplasmatota archaeon]|nr:4Fe-4S binding protein [Candidatus Thermoplasmatota archaeon]
MTKVRIRVECMRCGRCYEACKFDAIEIKDLGAERDG